MLSSTNDKSNSLSNIDIDTLISLHKKGLKPVALSENHKHVGEWTPIYENSHYWTVDKLTDPKESSKFKNVASTVGKTHIRDSDGNELFLQALDIDSEFIYSILAKPIDNLVASFSNLKSDILDFMDSLGLSKTDYANSTLLDILKNKTYVTKTRKPHGFHVWWLSHIQNKSVLKDYCKNGKEFELKADKSNGLCTLPPSTHRDDKGFRYYPIGRTDTILTNDLLYNLFIELFCDCLIGKYYTKVKDKNEDSSATTIDKPEGHPTSSILYNLTKEAVYTSASILVPFYSEHNRNNFTLPFGGLAYHCKVSEESAGKIISEICKRTNDEDLKERVITLHFTYRKAANGDPVTGGPTLVELMSKVKDCSVDETEETIKQLKALWYNDISISYGNNGLVYDGSNASMDSRNDLSFENMISVSEAKMLHRGRVIVQGKIMTCSGIFKMISATNYNCSNLDCRYVNKVKHPRPLLLVTDNETSNTKCVVCSKLTVSTEFEFTNAIEVELQDIDKVN